MDNNVVTPTVTVSVGSATETTIAASMSVTNNGNHAISSQYIDCFTDSGCSNRVGRISGSSGTFTGLSPNTKYYIRSNANNGTYTGYSGVSSGTTYQYPYVSAVGTSNLTIGKAQTLTLYNPLKRSVDVYMKQNNTSGTTLFSKTGATTGTSYSFTPTAATLYNSIPSASSGTAVYYCMYSSKNVSNKSGTYSVSGNNAQAPTFTDFNYEDTDTLAAQLTNKVGVVNPGILVSDLSDCKFTVPSAKKATSSFGATLDHYNFAWANGSGTSGTYSSSADVTGTVQNGNTNTISVSAYDKRSQYKTVSKTITLISPRHAYAALTVDRRNGIEATTFLNGSISYWSGDWNNGTSRPNNLYKVYYRVNGGSLIDITSSVTSNSTKTASGSITTLTLKKNVIQVHANGSSGGFTIGTSYNIEVLVSTGVTNGSTQYLYDNQQNLGKLIVTSGIFGMSRYKDSKGQYHYGINGMPSSDVNFKVNGSYDADAIYLGGKKLFWYE